MAYGVGSGGNYINVGIFETIKRTEVKNHLKHTAPTQCEHFSEHKYFSLT